jgi:hypothetical protein
MSWKLIILQDILFRKKSLYLQICGFKYTLMLFELLITVQNCTHHILLFYSTKLHMQLKKFYILM